MCLESCLLLQEGCSQTGVSVAFTVRAMDAGPVLAQEAVDIPTDMQAPELLGQLFEMGTQVLLDNLPRVWSGDAAEAAVPQASIQHKFQYVHNI